MKTITPATVNASNLKGMAKHTYNRVMSAIAEDTTAGMFHAFTALTDGAKGIALAAGRFSNTYINGSLKEVAADEAGKELADLAAGVVARKLRKIDYIVAAAFLAEYISRQRKENEPESTDDNATTVTEFSELTHAGQCLDIYLHNTAEIYKRYTVPMINAVVEAVKRNGWQLPKDEAIKNLTFWVSWQTATKNAVKAAARLVRKYDHMTPTAQDIEQVTRRYAAYIVECATFELENA